MAEHTKLPWKISPVKTADGAVMIVGGEGQEFGLIAEVTEHEDAEFICKAVNNHDALLKALRRLDTLLDFSDEDLESVWTFEDLTTIQEAFNEAKSALSLVGQAPERDR